MNNEIALLQQLAGLLGNAANSPQQQSELKKALTTSGGFLGINLEPQAKLLLPLFAGLRHRIAAVPAVRGAATAQWRSQFGYGSFAFGAAASFGTAFGANGPATAGAAVNFAADYRYQSISGEVQWEAIQQAMGWDSAMTIDTINALSLLLRLEELEVLYGNAAALAAPVITGVASTATAINTFAAGTWNVKVTAITGQGTITNAAANSNVGETVVSNTSAIVVGVGASDFLDVSWPAVPGALGYKVYASAAADGATVYLCDPNLTLAYANKASGSFLGVQGDAIVVPSGQTYVTVNRVQIIAAPANTQPTAPVADGSVNANMFEGVTAWCEKSTIYGTALSTAAPYVKDMLGMPLTAQGTGVAEFDAVLQHQWQLNHTSPSLVVTSSNGIVSLGNKIAAAGSNSQIRLDVYGSRNNIVGGLYIGGYVNKFASSMAGMQSTIDVWAHPYMPDGTFLFLSEDVPVETLPYARTAKNFELDVQTPYTYFELGRNSRTFPYDVFFGETLKNYWPSAQSAIVGARMDS